MPRPEELTRPVSSTRAPISPGDFPQTLIVRKAEAAIGAARTSVCILLKRPAYLVMTMASATTTPRLLFSIPPPIIALWTGAGGYSSVAAFSQWTHGRDDLDPGDFIQMITGQILLQIGGSQVSVPVTPHHGVLLGEGTSVCWFTDAINEPLDATFILQFVDR